MKKYDLRMFVDRFYKVIGKSKENTIWPLHVLLKELNKDLPPLRRISAKQMSLLFSSQKKYTPFRTTSSYDHGIRYIFVPHKKESSYIKKIFKKLERKFGQNNGRTDYIITKIDYRKIKKEVLKDGKK